MRDSSHPQVDFSTGEHWMANAQVKLTKDPVAVRSDGTARSAVTRRATAGRREWTITVSDRMDTLLVRALRDHYDAAPARLFRLPLSGTGEHLDETERKKLPVVQYVARPIIEWRGPLYATATATVVEHDGNLGPWA